MKSPKFRDYNYFVIWLDNCAGQNKNWTLITVLTQFVDQVDGLQSITLKYFTKGHTFMPADSFHKDVEDAMRKMGEVCDWNDFVSCVEEAGASINMEITDFYNFKSGLSSSMASKNSLDEVVVAKFCKGSSRWFYKRSHNSDTFQEHDFLLKKLLGPIMKGNPEISKKMARGINSTKKKHILDKLGPLMPLSRRKFFSDLEENQDSADLCNTF